MAVDKLVDSTQLDADLALVADAIRTRGGTSASLAFPADFVSAILAIPGSSSSLPQFTYSGTYELIEDQDGDWCIKLLSSGTLVFTDSSPSIEVFLVGGGGAGGSNNSSYMGGGGSGYRTTSTLQAIKDTQYAIVIGDGVTAPNNGAQGGSTTGFGLTAAGGYTPTGKTGGDGGSKGGNADNGAGVDGALAFNDTAFFYGYYGGSGGAANSGAGGQGGGAQGGTVNGQKASNATANTGGGGGGGKNGEGGNGGSGVILIRNTRS